MDQSKKRSPYSTPNVTKVALRKEQAVLSQCSVGVQTPDAGGPGNCFPVGGVMPNGCKSGPSGMGDSGSTS